MLWYTTKEKQKERIVKSLIYDGLDFLFEKADTMIRNEDASQLQKLYQLFEDMETPLAKLVKMFKDWIIFFLHAWPPRSREFEILKDAT